MVRLLLRDCQPTAILNYIWASSASVGYSQSQSPFKSFFALQEMSHVRYSRCIYHEVFIYGQNVVKGGKFGLWEADEIESKLRVSGINERKVSKG